MRHLPIHFKPVSSLLKLALTVVFIAIFALIALTCQKPEVKASDDKVTYQTEPATIGRFQLTVNATGKVVPSKSIEIKSKVGGEVQSVSCELGSTVKKGDLLVTLNPADATRAVRRTEAKLKSETALLEQARQKYNRLETTYKRQLAEAEAMLRSAETQVNELERIYQQKTKAFQQGEIPESEREAAATDLAAANAELDKATQQVNKIKEGAYDVELARQEISVAESRVAVTEIELEEAKSRLNETQIFSPIDGVITALNVQPGQIVSSGLTNLGGGTTLLKISDLSPLNVEASIEEKFIGYLSENLSTRIRADAYPDRELQGRIVQLSPQGRTIQDGAVQFDVVIQIEGENQDILRPGMTAKVEMIALEKSEVLLIPADAVVETAEGKKVDVLDSQGNRQRQKVELGLTNGRVYEVLDGLQAGDEVIVSTLPPSAA